MVQRLVDEPREELEPEGDRESAPRRVPRDLLPGLRGDPGRPANLLSSPGALSRLTEPSQAGRRAGRGPLTKTNSPRPLPSP